MEGISSKITWKGFLDLPEGIRASIGRNFPFPIFSGWLGGSGDPFLQGDGSRPSCAILEDNCLVR